MSGQGSPFASRFSCRPRSLVRRVWACARIVLLAYLVLGQEASLAAERTLRIRVAWGGGTARQWRGAISVSPGKIQGISPLGIDADSPGALWWTQQVVDRPASGLAWPHDAVRIAERSPKSYDGVDLTITAPADAKLIVALAARDATEDAATSANKPLEFPLANLLSDHKTADLDDQGNRLLVRRAPGDVLRLQTDREALIYAPGETLRLRMFPYALPVDEGARLRFAFRLAGVEDDVERWSHLAERTVSGAECRGWPAAAEPRADPLGIPLEIPLPREEGVYDLTVDAIPVELRSRIGLDRVVAQRSLQVVVLAAARPSSELMQEKWSPFVELDPTNDAWWKRYASLGLDWNLRRIGPLGSGDSATQRTADGDWVRLTTRADGEIAWQAYPLTKLSPGLPHVLELEYPANVPQSLGVSIVEPNAAGVVAPPGIDSGVWVPQEAVRRPAARLIHRFTFWPRTDAPLLLLTNRGQGAAMFGKLRVYAGPDRLPEAFPAAAASGSQAFPDLRQRRVTWAYLDRPHLVECFGAAEQFDAWSGRSLRSWTTFHQSALRMAEHLRHVGCDGLALTVLSEGAALYPSPLLQSAPRYENGTFFDNGQDAVPKDVLELLHRVFNREGLQLTPVLNFNAPLPELEDLLRAGGPDSIGLRWIGPGGQSWQELHPFERGAGAYYNVLHPRVQAAMLAAAREVVQRYGRHPSFAGLGIHLSASNYAQLAPAEWGIDDATLAAFSSETGVQVPGVGPERFAARAQFVTGPGRGPWLAWRAARLKQFYQQLRAEVVRARSDAALYLLGANMLDGPEIERKLRPSLQGPANVEDVLLELGFDRELLAGDAGLVFARPRRCGPLNSMTRQAVSQELDYDAGPRLDKAFASAQRPASLTYHEARESGLPSFDLVSPFGSTYTWLISQFAPSDEFNRRRFVHALATLDAQLLLDGGQALPRGQQEWLSELLAVYRQLPAERFRTLDDAASQPVTIRSLSRDGRTHVYLVNDSPWSVQVRLNVEASPSCRAELLGRNAAPLAFRQDAEGAYWQLDMEPYSLAGARFSEETVVISAPRVLVHPQVLDDLRDRIGDLANKAALLRDAPPLNGPGNSGFEEAGTDPAAVPRWLTTSREGVTIQLDEARSVEGDRALRLRSSGPIASVAGSTIPTPRTGRVAVTVWLRTSDPARQPPLRLAIEGKLDGRDYYRFATVGQGMGAPALGENFAQFVFQVHDLPLAGLTDLRPRFDLMGAGEVWIDEVRLYDRLFDPATELIELTKLITLADLKLKQGHYGDCERILTSYWPRFLDEFVPDDPFAVPLDSAPAGEPVDAAFGETFIERMKRYVPGWMRF